MKGTIGVESVPHTGSSFWFLLPFQRVTRAELPREAARLDAVNAPSLIETTARILLVEDNDINTRLAVAQFKKLGLTVSVATNGKHAVEAVQREHFDLVFMDCHMPEMDGFAATKEIRRLEAGTLRRVPIVAMTADARQGDQECCLSFGMDDYLSKPTSLATLRPVLDRWLPIA
ncbi:MAG: response regulator [Candidatus Eremiobacteraeota bacterium]|nr:response regulator [Candidatus Eremiobacteraeota bacterium]